MDYVQCKICNEVYKKDILHLHIRKHDIKPIDYYNKYIKQNNKCEKCGNETKFINLNDGYKKYCNKCLYKFRYEKLKQNNLIRYGVENISQTEVVKEKRKQTFIKKYGVINAGQMENHIKKTRKTKLEKYGNEKYNNIKKNQETCLEKYGVKNQYQRKEIKQKIKQTNLEKYGGTGFASKDIKYKIEQTKLVKYDDEKYLNQNKRKQTNLEKYGGTLHGSKIISNKIKQSNLEKYGVEYAQQNKDVQNKITKKKYNKKFLSLFTNKYSKFIIPLFKEIEYKGVNLYYKFKCVKCNNIFESNLDDGKIPRCTICFPYNIQTSKAEIEISNFLLQNNIDIISNTRKIIPPLELDIYIPDKNIAIEFNGNYTHSQLHGKKDKNYHLNKTILCHNKNIQLIHIFEDEWVYKKDIIQSMLKNKLNINSNKIYARKCIIKEIDSEIKKSFLENNHLQGEDNSSIRLGAFYNEKLVAVMTFGKSRYNKKYQYELIRFCNAIDTIVIGIASKFMKYFIKSYMPNSIITYADRRYSNGNLYKKLGFEFLEYTKQSYFYFKDNYLNRLQFQKHLLKNKLENFDEKLTEWENMQLNGYDRIWDCGCYKFVLNL